MEKSFKRYVLLVTLTLFFFFIHVSNSVPFILFHGIQDQCSNNGVSSFTKLLSNLSRSSGYCLEIGNGEEDSVYMPLTQQASIVNFVQDHIAPSGYIKITTEMCKYLEHSKYLPKLNNERIKERNSTFKERFTELQNLVLVMVLKTNDPWLLPKIFKTVFTLVLFLFISYKQFQDDTVVIPKESCWFGYYRAGASKPLLSPQQTRLYIEDWIGLKTLDVAGKVKFVSVPGDHLQIALGDVLRYVVPYLENQPTLSSDQ